MSYTVIRFGDKEFVANDLFIKLWMLEVARQIADDPDIDQWLRDLKTEWHLQATAGFGFGPTPALDEIVVSNERRIRLTYYFHMALKSLSERNGLFTPEELSLSGVGGPTVTYLGDIPTQSVIDVGTQFIQLIQ